MPHLIIEYSSSSLDGLEPKQICRSFRAVMANIDIFPLAGIRVRTYKTSSFAMADGDELNQFVALTLRVGQGRSDNQLKQAGQVIFETGQKIFSEKLSDGYFALSLEIVEINSKLSWKDNPIHARLNKEKNRK